MAEQKKLKFEDLQPHVDMLCDALENKGASPSGIPYNDGVSDYANKYRELLKGIRERKIGYTEMTLTMHNLEIECLKIVGNNQRYRIFKILYGVAFFVKREYNKVYKEGWQSG